MKKFIIATALVCLALLFAIYVIRINRMADLRDEYDALRHQTNAFSKPKQQEQKKFDDGASSDEDIVDQRDDSDESSEDEEDWPDDRDWRPRKRKEIREDGLVKEGDIGLRE